MVRKRSGYFSWWLSEQMSSNSEIYPWRIHTKSGHEQPGRTARRLQRPHQETTGHTCKWSQRRGRKIQSASQWSIAPQQSETVSRGSLRRRGKLGRIETQRGWHKQFRQRSRRRKRWSGDGCHVRRRRPWRNSGGRGLRCNADTAGSGGLAAEHRCRSPDNFSSRRPAARHRRRRGRNCCTATRAENCQISAKKHQSEASQSLITVINDLLSFSGMFVMKFSSVAVNCAGDALHKGLPTYGGLQSFQKRLCTSYRIQNIMSIIEQRTKQSSDTM